MAVRYFDHEDTEVIKTDLLVLVTLVILSALLGDSLTCHLQCQDTMLGKLNGWLLETMLT